MSEFWNSKYAGAEYMYGVSPNSFLVDCAPELKPQSKILCIGDGEGRNSVYLASLGHAVTALDLSQVGLDKMLELAKLKGVQVTPLLADLSDFDFGVGQWDAIVSIWCHTPSALRHQIHQKVQSSLIPNGVFVLEAYTPEQLKYKTGGPQDPDMLVTLTELRAEFSGFDLRVSRETIREVQEGKGHSGASAVVQFVAQKSNS